MAPRSLYRSDLLLDCFRPLARTQVHGFLARSGSALDYLGRWSPECPWCLLRLCGTRLAHILGRNRRAWPVAVYAEIRVRRDARFVLHFCKFVAQGRHGEDAENQA